jgi:hypothetical protein
MRKTRVKPTQRGEQLHLLAFRVAAVLCGGADDVVARNVAQREMAGYAGTNAIFSQF